METDIIEHEILRTLYTQASFTLTASGNQEEGYDPIYKRNYAFSVLHFGTLADAMYHPEKYSQDKRPSGDINYMQNKKAKRGDVGIIESQWYDLANAIDVLKINDHVSDSVSDKAYLELEERKRTLRRKGAIDFRNEFYIKEAENALSVRTALKIQRLDHWQKKNWLFVEIAKYVMGGIIGAAITLAVTQIGK